jgi:N-acetylmuramic acid 6-phosphate etherase
MAGGRRAVFRSVEGAEDDARAGAGAIRARADRRDAVVGIAASGITPFVRAALAEARRRGALTVLVTCNPSVPRRVAHIVIALGVGPEVLAGSTRLKAGTSTKLTLNTLTTAAFARLGKVHGNRMVDLQPKSAKLRARAQRLVRDLGGVSAARAGKLLGAAKAQSRGRLPRARGRDLTPSSGLLKNPQAAQKGPDARRRPTAAREAYSLYVERAAEGANEAGGPFSAACYEWLGPAVSSDLTGVCPRRKSKSTPSWAWRTWSRKSLP